MVIAPSVPAGRWREQLGLPIIEGLSVGATVVTTTETGLASWLEQQGHTVIPMPRIAELLARATAHALEHPLSVGDVIGTLPATDTRLEVDRWIHRPQASDRR